MNVFRLLIVNALLFAAYRDTEAMEQKEAKLDVEYEINKTGFSGLNSFASDEKKEIIYSLLPQHEHDLKIIQEEVHALALMWQEYDKQHPNISTTIFLEEDVPFLYQFFHQLLKTLCKKEFENMTIPSIAIQMGKAKEIDFKAYTYSYTLANEKTKRPNTIYVGIKNLIDLFFNFENKQHQKLRFKELVFFLSHELAHLFLHRHPEMYNFVDYNWLPSYIKTGYKQRLIELECDKYAVRACGSIFNNFDVEKEILFSPIKSYCRAIYSEEIKNSSTSLTHQWRLIRLHNMLTYGYVYFRNKYLDQICTFFKGDTHPSPRQRIQAAKEHLKKFRHNLP